MPVERKYERDIDILLAEEFAVSPAFAAWFLSQTRFRGVQAKVLDVHVSKTDSLGESDLVVVYEEINGANRFALLIEDKVNAILQPDQEARYRLRAQAEVARGDYAEFEVILCSPAAYATAQPKSASFDRFVSYEAIAEFLSGNDLTPRGQYRANFIASAAQKSTNTYVRVDDEITNTFWKAAYNLATREFPILEMKELTVSKDVTWIDFRPQDMPTRPRRTSVFLKGDRGLVDLTFSGTVLHLFEPLVTAHLDPHMTVHQTGKSVAIRLRVDEFRVSESWDDAQPKVRSAFAACERLIRFYREHRSALDAASSQAVPDWSLV